MNISKYFIIPIILLSMAISSCLNGAQERNNENDRIVDSLAIVDSLLLHGDIFSRLVYPEHLKEDKIKMIDTGDIVSFMSLGLYRKTLNDITQKYGKPYREHVYIGVTNDWDGDVEDGYQHYFNKLFLNIPKMEIMFSEWEINEPHILRLYLLKERDTFKVFYGYKLNYSRVPVE